LLFSSNARRTSIRPTAANVLLGAPSMLEILK
jgi:hypothetical protein